MINTGKTYKSLNEALQVLNTSYVKKDERIVLHYYSSSINDIDILVAVGTKNGIGPGSYSIISTNSVQIVEFLSELPDSSSLKNGQMYIWSNQEDSQNYRVFLDKINRVIEPIEGEMFAEDPSGFKYYITSTTIKRFRDFITAYDLEKAGDIKFLSQGEYNSLPSSEKTGAGNIFVICVKI